MTKFYYEFLGVFRPGGFLDDVQPSKMMADDVALSLSPKSNGIPQLNRTVAPVIVFAGTVDELVDELLGAFTDERLAELIRAKRASINEAERAEAEAMAAATIAAKKAPK